MNKQEIIDMLKKCDQELFDKEPQQKKIDCYIAGGSAFILNGRDLRITMDIDVLKTTGDNVRNLKTVFADCNINCDVAAFFDNFPVGFAKRAHKLDIDTKIFNFYILSVEDLVISKLCTTRYEQDLEDIESKEITSQLDWDLLKELKNKMKDSMISSLGYENLDYNYNNYIQKCKEDIDHDI